MKDDKATIFIKKILKMLHIKVNKNIENLIVQIFKFGIVGGTAFIIDFVCLYIFKEIVHLPLLVANTLSFTVSVIYNYIASVKWVFDVNNEKSKKKQFIIFIIFSVIGLIINDIIMLIGEDFLHIYYLIVKIIATAIVMVFNFITRKMFLE